MYLRDFGVCVLCVFALIMSANAAGAQPPSEGSGTAWLPAATPMYAIHAQRGPWLFMGHENAFLQSLHATEMNSRPASPTEISQDVRSS